MMLPETLVLPLVARAAGGLLQVHQRTTVAELDHGGGRLGGEEAGDHLLRRVAVTLVEHRAGGLDQPVARLQFGDAQAVAVGDATGLILAFPAVFAALDPTPLFGF